LHKGSGSGGSSSSSSSSKILDNEKRKMLIDTEIPGDRNVSNRKVFAIPYNRH
jgi:hypothetical protein